MVASDLMKSMSIPCEISFVKVSSYHGTASTGRVDELIGLNTNVRNRHIVLLEDIVDTGVTVDKVLKLLSVAEPASIKTCTLLFKPDAFKGKKTPDFIGFSVPDLFVVGYGLDYNELGRNLRDIYKLKED
jgi:hypoxanthine phosphoribosyltransferase